MEHESLSDFKKKKIPKSIPLSFLISRITMWICLVLFFLKQSTQFFINRPLPKMVYVDVAVLHQTVYSICNRCILYQLIFGNNMIELCSKLFFQFQTQSTSIRIIYTYVVISTKEIGTSKIL